MKLLTEYNRYQLAMMVLLFLLSGMTYYFLLRQVLIQELDEDLVERRERITGYITQHGALPYVASLDDVQVFYKEGQSANKEGAFTYMGRYDPASAKVLGYRQLAYVQPVSGKTYTISIIKPVEGMQSLLRMIVICTLLAILFIILLSFLLGRSTVRGLWRPFYEMVATMDRFTLSKKETPAFPDTDIDEFIFLKEHLQATIAKTQQEYRLLQEFTLQELQTPLAAIRSGLDLLAERADMPERQHQLRQDLAEVLAGDLTGAKIRYTFAEGRHVFTLVFPQ